MRSFNELYLESEVMLFLNIFLNNIIYKCLFWMSGFQGNNKINGQIYRDTFIHFLLSYNNFQILVIPDNFHCGSLPKRFSLYTRYNLHYNERRQFQTTDSIQHKILKFCLHLAHEITKGINIALQIILFKAIKIVLNRFHISIYRILARRLKPLSMKLNILNEKSYRFLPTLP